MSADRRLRVLMLARSYPNDVFPTFGLWTERPARNLQEFCDVTVISPVPYCPPGPRRPPFEQYTQFRDVERHRIRGDVSVHYPRYVIGPANRLLRFEPFSYRIAALRVARRLHRERPFDLVHGHFVHPDGVVARAVARHLGVPYVITDQAPWHPWLENPHVRRPALLAARDAAALVCVSRYLRDTIHRYLPDASVTIIPNGVDPDEFPLGAREQKRRNQVVFVGFINFNKGVDVLLEATRALSRDVPHLRVLLIGGSFFRNTRLQEEKLRRAAQDLVTAGTVQFLGRLPPPEVARHVRESSLLVLPSRAETFGAVLVEALASGTPVVSTYSGGPEDIVTPELGRLVECGDSEALAGALLEVLRAPDEFPPERLREHALQRWNWTRVAEMYSDLYYDVLASSSGTSPVQAEYAHQAS